MTSEKRVVIVGCGGIGTWLAHAMARALEFQAPGSMMVLVDGDTFEEKNIERQMFETIGNKAQVLRSEIQALVPQTMVVAMPAWVVPEDQVGEDEEDENIDKISASSLMNDGDVVFAVVDNYAARKLILDAAGEYDNIDVFIGGNDDALYGTTGHYQRRDGQDITHHPGVFHDEFVNPPDKNPGELSCAERAKLDGGTQLLAVNMAVTANLMAKASYLIFGNEEQQQKAIAQGEVCFDFADCVMLAHDRRTEYGLSLEEKSKEYVTA